MIEDRGYWQSKTRLGERRVSRRRLLQGAALGGAGLAAAALIGCGGEEKPPTGTARPAAGAKQPKRGGTLRTGTSTGVGRLAHLDPQVDSPVYSMHMRLMYQALLGYDTRTFEVQPQLAQKWEQPSQTEYVFTLQPGVKFHNRPPANGREMAADDVVFSLERARTKNPRFTSSSLLEGVKIEAVEKTRVKLTTKEPQASFLAVASSDPFVIMAREVLDKAGVTSEPAKLTSPDQSVGTGAFMITKWDQATGADYVRNPDYWKTGLPYVDSVQTPYIKNYQEAYAAFLGGQLDIAIVPGQEVKSFNAKQAKDYKPLWAKEPGSVAFAAPNTKVKPLDDARVTRALRLLVDHDEWRTGWAENWFGGAYYASYLHAALDTWDLPQDEFKKYIFWKKPKDEAVKEALALLSAAGFTKANPLKFEVMGRGDTGDGKASSELLQDQWRQNSQGVAEVQLKLVDSATYQGLRGKREYTYSMMSNAPGYQEPDGVFKQEFRSGAVRNYYNNSDPKLDALIDKQATIFDSKERKAFIHDILRYMIENSPGMITTGYYWLNTTNPKLQGFVSEVLPQGQVYERLWFES